MVSDQIKKNFCTQIKELTKKNFKIIIVHGGGPFIQKILDDVGIKSEFINGHRYTDSKSIKYIDMALSGEVNGDIVRLLNNHDVRAVGLSGKDANLIEAEIRKDIIDGKEVDLGRVGDVIKVNKELIEDLIKANYIPVISPISTAKDGELVNINADMFAGEIAGALKVDNFIILTDVDGLYSDFSNKSTLLKNININNLDDYHDAIVGGMIPKIDSINIALNKGAKSSLILNGSKENRILDYLLNKTDVGSKFTKN